MDKKQVSGDVPFALLHEMGHNTRAMEGFFSLPRAAREALADAVAAADDPQAAADEALKSLAFREEAPPQ